MGLLWTIIAGRRRRRNNGGSSSLGGVPPPTKEETDPDYFDPTFDGPLGPYIVWERSSEMITLPTPEVPTMHPLPTTSTRTNCPWDNGANFVPWNAAWVNNDKGDVTLPAGQTVLLQESISLPNGLLTIPPDTEFIVADVGLSLDVAGILVQGKLTVGAETCPLHNPLTITLHGVRPSTLRVTQRDETTPIPTYKGIHVVAGTGELQLHGKRYFPTWTRLARTIDPTQEPEHARTILLQQAVNWEPGQQIVVVTAALKDSRDWHQNEVRTIASVTNNPTPNVGAMVIVTEPLQYRHIANKQYQVEVGLLSRSITVQGAAEDSEPTDPDPLSCTLGKKRLNYEVEMGTQCPDTSTTGYGGHILVEGLAQIEGGTYVQGSNFGNFRNGQT